MALDRQQARRRNVSAAGVFGLALLAQLVAIAWFAGSWRPSFYHRQLEVQPEALAVRGAEFEAKLEEFRQLAESGDERWSIRVTDQQINGWLAVELPRRYPRSLPHRLHDPRIAIEAGQCLVACQFVDGGTRIVLTMAFQLVPTPQANEVRFLITAAKIGSVPGLEHEAVGQIAHAAYRSRIRLRWIRRDIRPEAIVRVPDRWLPEDRQVYVDRIQYERGAIRISGRSADRPQRPPPAAQHHRTAPHRTAPAPNTDSRNSPRKSTVMER